MELYRSESMGKRGTEKLSEATMRQYGSKCYEMVDSLIQTLGPDPEFMQDIWAKVGTRLHQMGVKASFFHEKAPLHAMVYALQQSLKRQLTIHERNSLEEVYGAMASVMRKKL